MTTRLTAIEGTAVPLPIENLDTDQIMPKQFLRIIDKAGLANGLFYDLRFDESGERVDDCVLNLTAYRGARILLGGSNFGCGSSREHAVWGLQQGGFDAVIASSFAEIFYSNAMNNRLLLVQLERTAVDALVQGALNDPTGSVHIDLEEQTVTSAGGVRYRFELSARHKRMMVEGMDTIDLSLAALAEIEAFESRHFESHRWAAVL